MDTAPVWIGIDVAKEQLDVAVGSEGDGWSVGNDEAGIRELLAALSRRSCALIVLEATGGFETAVVSALVAAGLPVVVINPRQVRNFARALGQLARTDRLDGRVLALFAERVRPEVRPLPDASLRLLDALLGRRASRNPFAGCAGSSTTSTTISARPFRTVLSGGPGKPSIAASPASAPWSRAP